MYTKRNVLILVLQKPRCCLYLIPAVIEAGHAGGERKWELFPSLLPLILSIIVVAVRKGDMSDNSPDCYVLF